MGKQQVSRDVQAMINAAVEAGRKAGREEAIYASPFRQTEKRLYALPDLKERVKEMNDDINELEATGLHYHSRDIVLLNTGSARVTEEDKIKALVKKKYESIESDEREIRAMNAALGKIADDEYYLAVEGHYINKWTDEEIAAAMGIKVTVSIYRNRRRLVNRLAVILYGSEAVN